MLHWKKLLKLLSYICKVPIVIKLDSLIVVTDFNQENLDQPWGPLIGIYANLVCNYSILFLKVPMIDVLKAHKLAKLCFCTISSFIWVGNFPNWL